MTPAIQCGMALATLRAAQQYPVGPDGTIVVGTHQSLRVALVAAGLPGRNRTVYMMPGVHVARDAPYSLRDVRLRGGYRT